MEIARIKSLHPATEYTPSWNFPVGVAQWKDTATIDTIREWLISKEDHFITTYPIHHDGKTGLGNDSVTARHGTYNLFHMIDELPEFAKLLEFLQISYIQFIQTDQTSLRDLHIFSWYNIARKGNRIEEHAHGADHESYLSGNMHFDDYHTANTYSSPFDPRSNVTFRNAKGGLTMFPSCLPHESDVYNDEKLRVSFAFDLRLSADLYTNKPQSHPFMNAEIFESLVNKYDIHFSRYG